MERSSLKISTSELSVTLVRTELLMLNGPGNGDQANRELMPYV